MQRFSSYSSSSSCTAPSQGGSSVTTIGLGTISGRAILALGEAAIYITCQLTTRRRSILSLASTATSVQPQGVRPLSTESKSSSSTVPGPGELSGKMIKALGKLTLRRLDDIQLLLRLGKLKPFFPHGRRVFWEPDDGEEMYEELLDMTRPGIYSTPVRRAALDLLLSQIGFREINQLLRALFMWDAEGIVQLLFQLLEAASDATGVHKKTYLRFQDAPDIDPLLPFATFLLQLSFISLASSQAARAVGSFLFDRLSNQDEPSLAYHLLFQISAVRSDSEDRNPFEDSNPFEDRNPFEDDTPRPRTIVSLPDDVGQWKFSWLLSCVAYEGEYWNVLIKTLSQSREGIRNASILRLVYCVLGLSSSDPDSHLIDQHLLSGFHLACRQGAKSTVGIVEKDPVELTLRFLLRAVSDAPSLRTAFGSADDFLVIIQPCLQSDAASAREVLHLVVGGVLDGFVEGEAPKPDAERMRLCWEIYKLIRGDVHDQERSF